MELVLIRHGRVAGHPYNPTDDVPLGDIGRRQAAWTAGRLAGDAPYDWLVSSPLARARQTAEIIGAGLGKPFTLMGDLREVSRREVGRALLVELAHRLGLAARLRDPIIARVDAFLTQTRAAHNGQRVVVVSHGGFIWGTLVHLFPAQRGQFARRRPVANCAITRIALAPDGAHMLALNDVSHLHGEVTA
ncbi:MAG: histidine phosphatase family protein [Chloroflexi bacterium]|nr:histidine phosphatase family protein [Chloroflexota bacterium]